MPTLYSQADSNVRKTWFLITLFLVLIIGVGWVASYVFETEAILYVAVIFSVFSSVSSYWYSDKIVLASVNAKPIEKKDNPELYRLVENLCIASGLPLPKIYILDEEQPNAFTTGRDEKHAIVAVTKGLLEKLERRELEGVIAHELAHIKNKDMLLGTVVVVLAGTIAIMSDFLLRMSFGSGNKRDSGSSKQGGGLLMILIIVIAVILAPIAAEIIRLSISRKREFLADASGALITRYPEGLASALEKIASDPNPLKKQNNASAHLFIASPLRGKNELENWLTKLYMTHPPVEERIKALRQM